MNDDAYVEHFFKRKFDIKSGRWNTAIMCSIVYGFVIVTIGMSIATAQYYFYKYAGIPLTDDDSGFIVTRNTLLLYVVVIAPVLESIGVIFIYFILIEFFHLRGVIFIVLTAVVFGWLHKHPFNGGVIFLLLSIQYLFMRTHYRRAIAFWSIVISHAVNNASIVAIVLILTAFLPSHLAENALPDKNSSRTAVSATVTIGVGPIVNKACNEVRDRCVGP